MITPSLKTLTAHKIIARLRSLDSLAGYVLPDVFSAASQQQLIKTLARTYGGCVVVSPQLLGAGSEDRSVRDGRVECIYLVVAIVDAKTWRARDGVDPTIKTASDMIDALLGQCVELLAGWRYGETTDQYPIVMGEQDMAIVDDNLKDCITRGLLVSVILNHPTYQ